MASSLLQTLITWMVVAAAASLVASRAYRYCRPLLTAAGDIPRAFLLLVYALLPLASACAVLLLLDLPVLGQLLIPTHCHDASCAPHQPAIELRSLTGVALASTALTIACALLASIALALGRLTRRVQALRQLARPLAIAYRELDSSDYFAWCAGLLRQEIYISSALARGLTPDQLQAVLVHESIHRARFDNLRKTLVRCASLCWPRRSRARLLADFDEATERACHALTCQRLGEPASLLEADAILAAGARGRSGPPSAQQAWDTPPGTQVSLPAALHYPVGWLLVTALWFGQVVVLTGTTHLALEWVTQ